MAIPHPGGQQRTCKYIIVHDVLFFVSYIKLNCFTSVYLIINLYFFVFTGSPKRPTSTHTPAGESSGSHSSSFSVHESGEEATAGVGGEVPHETSTLNAYIFFFQLSVPLIYIDFNFTYS